MLESLFNKVPGLKRSATLLKRDSNTDFFLQIFSTEHLWLLLLKSKKFSIFSAFCYDWLFA